MYVTFVLAMLLLFLHAGFGEFHGVKNNPTEQLVSSLQEYLSKHPLPSNVTVDSCTVLETSGVGSRESLHALRAAASQKAEQDGKAAAPCHKVWVSSMQT